MLGDGTHQVYAILCDGPLNAVMIPLVCNKVDIQLVPSNYFVVADFYFIKKLHIRLLIRNTKIFPKVNDEKPNK